MQPSPVLTLSLKDTYPFLWEHPFLPVDRQFALYLQRDEDMSDPITLLAAACTVAASRSGHAYLDLENPPFSEWEFSGIEDAWPSLEQFQASLAPYAWVPERPLLPFVLEKNKRLYLTKYWDHERTVAEAIKHSVSIQPNSLPATSQENQHSILSSLFPDSNELDNPQYQAVHNALSKKFFLITGGPGTGKTTTILKLLTALIKLSPEHSTPPIALAAPTGKAAARMHESITQGIKSLKLPPEITQKLPQTAHTLHRLLGSIPNSISFRHNKKKPLAYELIVVDEASMIDLPMMRRFLDAIPESCRVILLGDPNQLSSVQVGSILKDIVESALQENSPISQCHSHLDRTYRFSDSSGIGALCKGIQNNSDQKISSIIDKLALYPDITYKNISESPSTVLLELAKQTKQQTQLTRTAASPEDALQLLTTHQILCPTQIGPLGTHTINAKLSEYIAREFNEESPQTFSGQPILILENNYDLQLFNGDLGVLWSQAGEPLKAWFSNAEGNIRSFSIIQLPRHETAFAMTIHKSQGSEFDQVTTIISSHTTKMLTKELLYTAFSRAKKSLNIYSDKETLNTALQNSVNRATGLADRLST